MFGASVVRTVADGDTHTHTSVSHFHFHTCTSLNRTRRYRPTTGTAAPLSHTYSHLSFVHQNMLSAVCVCCRSHFSPNTYTHTTDCNC